jgi:hypothetical protein
MLVLRGAVACDAAMAPLPAIIECMPSPAAAVTKLMQYAIVPSPPILLSQFRSTVASLNFQLQPTRLALHNLKSI